MDWLDLLAVQGTLKSLLQHHSSKASILQRSAFFTVQLSQPHITTGKTITLTRWTFVGKVMSLLLNMLSRLVITFLPRSKRFLISWLQSPSAVILEPPKIKSDTVSTVSPSWQLIIEYSIYLAYFTAFLRFNNVVACFVVFAFVLLTSPPLYGCATVSLFICYWTFALLPVWGCNEQSRHDHLYMSLYKHRFPFLFGTHTVV